MLGERPFTHNIRPGKIYFNSKVPQLPVGTVGTYFLLVLVLSYDATSFDEMRFFKDYTILHCWDHIFDLDMAGWLRHSYKHQ